MIPLYSAAAAHAGLDLEGPIRRVLQRQWFILGEETKAFETEFAAWLGVGHCVGVANGTDALELALRALDVGPGDQVLCAANAGFYAATAAAAVGAQAVHADVDGATLVLTGDGVRAALRSAAPKPKCVVATHLYGQLADVQGIAAACREAGVPWIEDSAQAHGAARNGRRAGSFGDLACFSFYPTKNLGALGDGGAVVTSDLALAERVRALRQYGWAAKYEVALNGGRNSRLDELQAAVLRQKLPRLEAQNGERRDIARRYNAAFAGLPLQLPGTGEDHACHLYVIRTPRRDALRAHLKTRDVASDVHYPIPDHRQPVRREADAHVSLPVTEAACREVLSLPCYPGLQASQADQVIAAVHEFFAGEGHAC